MAAGDSFYDYGGSSLQAMRVCVLLQRRFRVDVEPVLLMESESLGEFAAAVCVRVGG